MKGRSIRCATTVAFLMASLLACKSHGPAATPNGDALQGSKARPTSSPSVPDNAVVPSAAAKSPVVPQTAAPTPRFIQRQPGPGPINSLERFTDVALAAVATGDTRLYERVMFGEREAKLMCPEMLVADNAAIAQRKFAQERQRLTAALAQCAKFDWSKAERLSDAGGAIIGPEARCKDVIAHRPIQVHFDHHGQHVVVRFTKPARTKDGSRWVTAEPPSCKASNRPLPLPREAAFAKALATAIEFSKAACACVDEACHAAATTEFVPVLGDIAGPHRWSETEQAAIQLHLRNGQKCQPSNAKAPGTTP